MSAFLCDEKTFDNIASTLAHYAEREPISFYKTAHASAFIFSLNVKDESGAFKLHPSKNEQTAEFAQRLYAMNLSAVSQRYKDGHKDDYGYKFSLTIPTGNTYQLYAYIKCLLYQCSEGDVPESDLFKRLESISDALAHDIVSGSKQFETASWG